MEKKILLIFTFILLISGLSTAQTWNCGDYVETYVTATLKNDTLTFSGNGRMKDFITAPWYGSTIKTVVIKDYVPRMGGVESIGSNAFNGCSSLSSVIIGNDVKRIGENAFMDCNNLTSITIPEKITNIDKNAFSGCSTLAMVHMYAVTCTLADNSLYVNATTINVGNVATNISISDLTICSKLTAINADSANVQYSSEDGILYSKDKTILMKYPSGKLSTTFMVPDGVKSIGTSAFSSCNHLTTVILNDAVTHIENYAFFLCEGLVSIDIPATISYIGGSAFSVCKKLVAINVGESATGAYHSVDGVLYNKNLTTLIQYPAGRTGTFSIPDAVTTVGMYAFEACAGLSSVTIPETVSLIDIGAFAECSGLTSVVIPSSVTKINRYAFANCMALQEINCKKTTPPAAESNIFRAIDKSACTLYVPLGCINLYNVAPWSDFKNIQERDFSALTTPEYQENLPKVYFTGNKLVIENVPIGEQVQFFDLSGILLCNIRMDGDHTVLPALPKGIYLVKTNAGVVKTINY